MRARLRIIANVDGSPQTSALVQQPMMGRVPDWLAGFGVHLFSGKADIAQHMVIKFGQMLPLTAQFKRGTYTAQYADPRLSGSAGAVDGEHWCLLCL
jgi:hypothetical protein